MKKLYSNIGNTLCSWGKWYGWIGIIMFAVSILIILFFLLFFFYELNLIAYCILGGIALAGLLCFGNSWLIYAFGQLVNDVHKMASGTTQPNDEDEIPEL